MVAGAVIGYKLPVVSAGEFGQVMVVYFLCAVIRGLVVGISYVSFIIFGAILEAKDQVVLMWGGLRGAVGMSLAMMVSMCFPYFYPFFFQPLSAPQSSPQVFLWIQLLLIV